MTAKEWAKAFDDLSWRFKGLEADRNDLAKCLIEMRLKWAKSKRERDELVAQREKLVREIEDLRKETWDHGGAFGQFERDRND